MENVVFHASHGMALVAQRSTNFRFSGGGVYPRAETGRKFSAGADATHFSNCRGEIVVENAHFEGMMDDAINVHATCLRIEEKVDSHTLRCRYIHGQAYGFETFLPGETLRYIRAKWLQPVSPQKVKEVVWLDSKTFLLKMEASIPPFIQVGDAVENADWFPSVMFRKNVVRNNRARGSLFTTPLPVVIEGNLFETIAGSAILLAGDANGWYESGACHDVVIRHNTFRNNLTSRFQFTEGILSFYPEIPDVAGQPERYHRNIRIEQNRFETFDVPLLFAISTDGILFRENTIEYNQAYSGWNRPAFILNGCEQVVIENNRVLNSPRPWQKDGMVERMNTPEDEVRFN
jgi:hypothetical protein